MNIFSSFRTEGVVRAIERASAMNQVAPETAAGGEEEFFRCSDLDKKDNDAFVEWWANRVVILDLNSALAEAGRTAWTCLPSLTGPAPGEVEGVYPTNTQHFLNALHSANLMLQKDTQCFKLIVQADDQVRVCSSASATACVNVCVCVCLCVCWVCMLILEADDQAAARPDAVSEADELRTGRVLWNRAREGVRTHLGLAVSDQLWNIVCGLNRAGRAPGQVKRSDIIDRCQKDPSFLLDFGPVGDTPLHLAFLLGKFQLGLDMIDAVRASPDYWSRCEELVRLHGGVRGAQTKLTRRFPQLPVFSDGSDGRDVLSRTCSCDSRTPVGHRRESDGLCKSCRELHSFIINIPYQSDLTWWFDMWERRERGADTSKRKKGNPGGGGEGNAWPWPALPSELGRKCRWREYVPEALHSIIRDDASASLFAGETLLHIAIQAKHATVREYTFASRVSTDVFVLCVYVYVYVYVCVCACVCVCVCACVRVCMSVRLNHSYLHMFSRTHVLTHTYAHAGGGVSAGYEGECGRNSAGRFLPAQARGPARRAQWHLLWPHAPELRGEHWRRTPHAHPHKSHAPLHCGRAGGGLEAQGAEHHAGPIARRLAVPTGIAGIAGGVFSLPASCERIEASSFGGRRGGAWG